MAISVPLYMIICEYINFVHTNVEDCDRMIIIINNHLLHQISVGNTVPVGTIVGVVVGMILLIVLMTALVIGVAIIVRRKKDVAERKQL